MWCTTELVGSLCARREVPGSNLTQRVYFFPFEDGPLVPVIGPGTKGQHTFSPGFLVPVGKPGVEVVPNWD